MPLYNTYFQLPDLLLDSCIKPRRATIQVHQYAIVKCYKERGTISSNVFQSDLFTLDMFCGYS